MGFRKLEEGETAPRCRVCGDSMEAYTRGGNQFVQSEALCRLRSGCSYLHREIGEAIAAESHAKGDGSRAAGADAFAWAEAALAERFRRAQVARSAQVSP